MALDFSHTTISNDNQYIIRNLIKEYTNKLVASTHNDKHLERLEATIIRVLMTSEPEEKKAAIKSFFSTTNIAPNCKEVPLDSATKKKCFAGLATGFALLAASVFALAVNPILSIAVAAVAVGVLLTSAAVFLNGGPMPDLKSEERTILDTACNM